MMGKYLGMDITSLIAPSSSPPPSPPIDFVTEISAAYQVIKKQPSGYHHDNMTKTNLHKF